MTQEEHEVALRHERDVKDRAMRFAFGILIFAVLSSVANGVFSARVADGARADAVAVAEANEQKLCETFTLLTEIYTDPSVPKTYTVGRLTRAFVVLLNSLDCRDDQGRTRPDLPVPPQPTPGPPTTPSPVPRPNR